jgi:cobalamin biosynthesis Mg chelatase CobN
MSEELSRVKSRRKQNNGKGQPQLKREKAMSTTLSATAQNEPVVPVTGTLSRKAKYAAASPKPAGNRQTTQEAEDTPSRSQSYPSERIRLSKIFVNSLYFIFVLLLASLVWWGIEGAPELRTLW